VVFSVEGEDGGIWHTWEEVRRRGGSDIRGELTSVQLHFNLLFALCEKETLEPA
jgi:hypothetical protein